MRVLVLVCAALPLLPCLGCASGPAGFDGLTWTNAETSIALKPGTTVRGSYYPNISPTLPTWYAFHQGRRLQSLAELRPHLVTLDRPEKAVAFRDLARRIELEGQPADRAKPMGVSLRYAENMRTRMAEYGPDDAKRWGVGHEPVVEARDGAFVITEPQFRWPEVKREDAAGYRLGTAVVELVRETITSDGRYEREVLRVLEEGDSATRHEPTPLM